MSCFIKTIYTKLPSTRLLHRKAQQVPTE